MKAILSLVLVSLVTATPVFEQIPINAELATFPGFDLDLNAQRLVEMEGQAPVWMTELEKIQAKAQGIKFFDITDSQELGLLAHMKQGKQYNYPVLNAKEKVNGVIKTLSSEGPKANLEEFTKFRTRYYRSDTGQQSQQWLLSKISEYISQYASKPLQKIISLSEFKHAWGQNSIIVKINGSSSTNDGVVIIGAHQDSANSWPYLPAPGADDDGSGTVTILESFRALITSNFRPVRTVEFHWYAAEEGSLLGSQAVAQDYEARSVNVIAMGQFDMTAWVKHGTREEVGVVTDFTDPKLTEFNIKLIDLYLDIPYAVTTCGYACSDHASWMKAGFPSVFSFESQFENHDDHIHSVEDLVTISDEFSFSHMLEFSKLAVAFAIELGGWK